MQRKIVEELKRSGLRITPIRKEIFELLENSAKPFSVHEILSTIKANKTTIYREINVLLNNNYLIEVDFADGSKRYELSNLGHHHHLICIKCHKVQDVTIKERLSDEEELISKTKKFKVLKHNLEFFGYCQNCI